MSFCVWRLWFGNPTDKPKTTNPKRLWLLALLAGCSPAAAEPEPGGAAGDWVAVARADLARTLVEIGEVRPRRDVEITHQLGGLATIQELAPEGSRVAEGDLLCRLDDVAVRLQIAEAERGERRASLKLQIARDGLAMAEADRDLEVPKAEEAVAEAERSLTRYEEGDWPQQLREHRLALEKANFELTRAKRRHEDQAALAKEGMVTPAQVEEAALAAEEAVVGEESARKKLELLERYTHPLELRQKRNAVAEGRSALASATARHRAAVGGARSGVADAEREHTEAEEALATAREKLGKTVLRAPVPGLVVWGELGGRSWWGAGSDNETRVGARLYEGQTIITLPDLTDTLAACEVNEVNLLELRVGLPARVSFPAFPGADCAGEVSRVAAVGNRWGGEVHRFSVEVRVTGSPAGLRPGMTAEVRIALEPRRGVLAVPAAAVHAPAAPAGDGGPGDGAAVTVLGATGPEERRVVLGPACPDKVEVLEGLREGESVLVGGRP
ncbi:MAG: hypothetical protein L0216_02700 [Planctomycetales bacterium]|nr:hypothetical protein [Planctomycetales bacterium]